MTENTINTPYFYSNSRCRPSKDSLRHSISSTSRLFQSSSSSDSNSDTSVGHVDSQPVAEDFNAIAELTETVWQAKDHPNQYTPFQEYLLSSRGFPAKPNQKRRTGQFRKSGSNTRTKIKKSIVEAETPIFPLQNRASPVNAKTSSQSTKSPALSKSKQSRTPKQRGVKANQENSESSGEQPLRVSGIKHIKTNREQATDKGRQSVLSSGVRASLHMKETRDPHTMAKQVARPRSEQVGKQLKSKRSGVAQKLVPGQGQWKDSFIKSFIKMMDTVGKVEGFKIQKQLELRSQTKQGWKHLKDIIQNYYLNV